MADRSTHDLIAAHHEAGHAVGAFLLGVPFDCVSISGSDSGEGSVRASLPIGAIRELGLRWEHAIIAMLGQATERLVYGRVARRYVHEDAECLAKLYLTFFAREMSGQAFRAELRRRTAQVIGTPGFREAVEALARLLAEAGRVDEEQAVDILRRTVVPFGSAREG